MLELKVRTIKQNNDNFETLYINKNRKSNRDNSET